MRTLLRLIVALLALAVLAVAGVYFYVIRAAEIPLQPKESAPAVEIRVPKGATLNQVGKLLEDSKLIKSALIWRAYVRLKGGKAPQAGRHAVSGGMATPELLTVLSSTPLSDDVPLTLVEGWRIRDADLWLSESKLIERGSYIRAAETPSGINIPFPFEGTSLEGYLFPETYMIPPGPIEVQRLVQRQINAFHDRFYQPNTEEIKNSKRSLRDLVIMASLLEREEPDPALRPQVAGVLYKRLDAGQALGVDATSRFKLADWNDRKEFLKALRDPGDGYNTRLHAGLPPGPIGAPGIESLLSALRPVASPYWYYLHDSERHIHFAKNAEEHEANRKKFNVY